MKLLIHSEKLPSGWMSSLMDRFAVSSVSDPSHLEDSKFYYELKGDKLNLVPVDGSPKISLDWEAQSLRYLKNQFSFRKELLVRALGVSENKRTVVDGTLGFGTDFFLLWFHKVPVIGVEMDAVPCFMSHWEMNRFFDIKSEIDPNLKKASIKNCKIETFLESEENSDEKVLYLDPIFPSRGKTALPKKNMSFLRSRGNLSVETERIWSLARNHNFERIVVKRPRKGEHLVSGVSYSIESKLIRYDVYRF